MKAMAGTAAALLCVASLAAHAAASAQGPEDTHIDMQGTSIIGDRELPTVLYLVPWKDAAPAGAAAQPVNRRADTAPVHLSRDQVQRQLRHRQRSAGE